MPVATNAIVLALALLFGIGCGGIAAVIGAVWHVGHAQVLHTCRNTRTCIGTISTCLDLLADDFSDHDFLDTTGALTLFGRQFVVDDVTRQVRRQARAMD